MTQSMPSKTLAMVEEIDPKHQPTHAERIKHAIEERAKSMRRAPERFAFKREVTGKWV